MDTLLMTIELPGVPPSQNHAYENKPKIVVNGRVVDGGGRRLTEEGQLYKKEVTNRIARQHAFKIKEMLPNQPYELHMTFFFLEKELFNSGYPKKTKNRYKRVDTLNRGKLLEDAIADAFGLDDAHNFVLRLEKRPCNQRRTEVEVWRKEDEWTTPGEESTTRSSTKRAPKQG